ncbi:hypothetical protein [Paraburkholderia sediminicola]|uniref:hypothetical protein n=1 Tax=Paraburkholderia sediminicola TaxID=458836 RepID=UPI0038B738A8
MSVDPSATGEPEVESSVIEWLLHDDQAMRECFTHAAEILKSVPGAAITAITLLDEEHQHYRAEVGMAMPLVTRARSLPDYAVRERSRWRLKTPSKRCGRVSRIWRSNIVHRRSVW